MPIPSKPRREADGSKLAVAGIIEGTFSEEGLSAMSDVRDLTSQMAKELSLGIKDNVEDIAAAFKKMAVINRGERIDKSSPYRPRRAPRYSRMPAVEHPAAIRHTGRHPRSGIPAATDAL